MRQVQLETIGQPQAHSAELFGRYRLIRTLAFGGMAQIYLAVETTTGRAVVIKKILPHYASDPEFVQFFIHEGRLGQRLRHKHLVETFEAGRIGDDCFIAMEYLRGAPAIELLRAAARARVELPLGVAVRIVADAARGLHYAHIACDDRGQPLNVVHRDVTPHNLFVSSSGATKVLDFGIAKAASQTHQTRAGTLKGKFAYLAPEQIGGQKIDHRVDVFALGIVLHELLTLRPLFRGPSDGETIDRIMRLEVPPPERLRAGVPPGLGAVALRALQRDCERRLPSAEALADSIEAVAEAEGLEATHALVARKLAELCPITDDGLDEETLTELHDSGPQRAIPPPVPTSCSTPSAPSLLSPSSGPPRHPSAVAVAPVSLSSSSSSTLSAIVLPPPLPPRTVLPTTPPRGAPAQPHRSSSAALLALRSTAARRALRRRIAARITTAVGLVGLLAALFVWKTWPHALDGMRALANAPARLAHERSDLARAPRPVMALGSLRAQALEMPPESTLRIETDGLASFLVDGRPMRPEFDGAFHLPVGHHKVVVSGPQFASTRTIEVDLRPKEAAVRALHPGHGRLRIAVTPWAEVTVDGRPFGLTPLSPIEIAEGSHVVALKNVDLGVVTRKHVIVSPNTETLLRADLFGKN